MPISPYRKQDLIGNNLLAALANIGSQYQQGFTKAQDTAEQKNLINEALKRAELPETVSSPSQLVNPDGTMNKVEMNGVGNFLRPDILPLLMQLKPENQNLLNQMQSQNKIKNIFGGEEGGYSGLTGNDKVIDLKPGIGRKPESLSFTTETVMVNGKPVTYSFGRDTATGEIKSKVPLGQARPTGSGNDANADLTEADKNVIKAIRDYRYPVPTSGFALRSPYWQKMIGAVMAEDPTFDAIQYNSRYQLKKDFASGKGAANIRSLNTVAQHIDKLSELGTALNNKSWQPANAVINYLKKATGNPSVTNFETAMGAVANEAVTVFKNTGATDQEIEHIRDIVGTSSSPEQIKGAIDTLLNLINGRVNALKNQYETGMAQPLDFRMLDKQTESVFKKHGINPADIGEQPTPTPAGKMTRDAFIKDFQKEEIRAPTDAELEQLKAQGLWE